MKQNVLKSLLALALVSLGSMNVAAQNETATAPVKMTYVSGSDADVDVAYGECDTIKAGWNLGNDVAVGTTIKLGNKGWGANWIGVLKADLSAVPGTVQKATLKAKVSGSLDNKRVTGWGVALTDNEWSADLTYTTVSTWTVSAMLNGGVQVWTTSKSATGFEEHEWDITDAFAGGQSVATILVYEGIKDGNGGAAGGFMTEAEVEVEYEPFEATTTTYDFEDGTIPFVNGTNSGSGRITAAIEADATLNSNVLGWTCASNSGNGYSFSYYDFNSVLNNPALVQVEFDYYNTKGGRATLTIGDALVRGTDGHHSKATYNPNGAIFRIGSEKPGNANEAFINDVMLNQDDKTITTPLYDEGGNQTGELTYTAIGLCDKWLHVAVVINNDARTVTWVVTDQEGELVHYGSSPFFAEDALSASQIDLFSYINNSHCAMIDNLVITNYKSNAVFADYTVRYVDPNGNEIKASRTGNGQVGKFVKLLDSDKAAIVSDYEGEDGIDGKMKYIYDFDDSETVAIADGGTAVITVTYKKAEIFAAVLNCMIDGQTGTAARLASFQGKFFEGDNYYVYPSRGYSKEGKYYFTEATSWNGTTYTFPGSLNPRTINSVQTYIGQLNYVLDETVAYYSDFERLALPVEDAGEGTGLGQLVGTVNNWWSFSNGIFDRFSQGRGIRLDVGSYVYTEPIAEDGTYMVRIYGRNDQSANCTAPYSLGLRDAEGNVTLLDVTAPDWGSATTGESIIGAAAAEATEDAAAVEAAGIGIPAGYSLVVINTGNGDKISLDDLKLTKVADYAETPTKAPAYTVAGAYQVGEEQQAAFFGAAWDPAQNDMTANEDGTYSKKFENVTFEQTGTIYYKVAVNHGWVESYGFDDNNADYWVEVPEGQTRTADVIFTFDPATKAVSCVLENKVVEQTYTATFINTKDWEKVCVWAWNGGTNLYEAWPGVEATKTDRQVDGHDVYTWSYTGPVAPAMIIFNNGNNGEQTADLVFVNEGIYDADGITTGINAIAVEKANTVVFNLKGQRVMNAQKGLYIINGKKVVK